ncbi:MAG: C2H2-type zinc finger protein [Candidatus Nitrosoabyssus spongiisocia]|nr:MAG: C2H2-type zinc finger protein [Nitrosopumilaceae archaeon AB1(1)]
MNIFKRHKCDMCNEKFKQEEDVMHHKLTIHYKNNKYDCNVCGVEFSGMEQMRTHMQKFHTKI